MNDKNLCSESKGIPNSYFFGTASPNGFFSCFNFKNECDGGYTYILKGGPGTGKSSLMNAVASFMENNDINCERYYCSSDPKSLDAVVFPSMRIKIIDGTAPHISDPNYPGAADEIVNLGECWNNNILFENKDKIKELTDKNREFHEKSKRFISCAFSLYSDGEEICSSCVDKERIRRYASRTASKKIKRLSSKIGKEDKRLIEAITPDGYLFMSETVSEICDEIIVLKDDFAVASSLFLDEIKNYALASGYNIKISPELSGKKSARHIIIDELSIGFFIEDSFMKPDIIPTKIINMNRFYDGEKMKAHKVRMKFIKTASKELLNEACLSLNDARQAHNALEKIYIDAMNFDLLNKVTEKIRSRIWNSEWFTE